MRRSTFLAIAVTILLPAAARGGDDSAWTPIAGDNGVAAWRAAGSGDERSARALLATLPHSAQSERLKKMLDEGAAVPAPDVRIDSAAPAVKFRVERNGTPVVHALVNGVEVEMGVDTGAGLSVLARSVATRVKARSAPGMRPATTDSLGQQVDAEIALVDLTVGGLQARDLPVLVVADERLRARLMGVTLFAFDGLVGWNALSRARVVVGFGPKEIALQPPRSGCATRDLYTLGFKPLIEMRVNGLPMLALVDLGARTSFLVATPSSMPDGAQPGVSLAAGAGGVALQEGGTLSDVALELPGRKAALPKLRVRKRPASDTVNSLTLGLDVLGSGTLTLDFTCGEFVSAP